MNTYATEIIDQATKQAASLASMDKLAPAVASIAKTNAAMAVIALVSHVLTGCAPARSSEYVAAADLYSIATTALAS